MSWNLFSAPEPAAPQAPSTPSWNLFSAPAPAAQATPQQSAPVIAPPAQSPSIFSNLFSKLDTVVSKEFGGLKEAIQSPVQTPAPVSNNTPAPGNDLNGIPFTSNAKNMIANNTGVARGAIPEGTGANTEIGIPLKPGKSIIQVAPQQPPATTSHELFNSLFYQTKINPATFNTAWTQALKSDPDLKEIESQLSNPQNAPAYHGNGEDVSTNPYDLASERFALLGSLWGNDGISKLPKSLQPFYKNILTDPGTDQTPFDATASGELINTLKGLPKAALDVLQGIGQGSMRAGAALGTAITHQQPLTPEGTFQTSLYGTDQPITLESTGREFRDANPNQQSTGGFKVLDPVIGLMSSVANVAGFGGENELVDGSMIPKSVLQFFADESDASKIKTALVDTFKIPEQDADTLSQTLAEAKSQNQVKEALINHDKLASSPTAAKVVPNEANADPVTHEEAVNSIVKEANATPQEPKVPLARTADAPYSSNIPVLNAFAKSQPVKQIGDLVLGTFGERSAQRKAGQPDRFPASELPETVKNIKGQFKASNDPTNYRSDNIVHIAQMPDGQVRAIYTRENVAGKQEIINWHNVTDPNYLKALQSFGTPERNRTSNASLRTTDTGPSGGSTESVGQKPVQSQALVDEAKKYNSPEEFKNAVMYHGLSAGGREDILKNGFRNSNEGVFVTGDKSEAKEYGETIPVLIKKEALENGSLEKSLDGKVPISGTSYKSSDVIPLPSDSNLDDIYNQAHNIDTESNSADNKTYESRGSANDISTNRPGNGNLGDRGAISLSNGSAGSLGADSARLAGLVDRGNQVHPGEAATGEPRINGTTANRDLETLHNGGVIKIAYHTPLVLEAMGAPKAITDNILSYEKAGAITHVTLVPDIKGIKPLGMYGKNILYVNPDEFGHTVYTTGEILNHELDGHSFYNKLSDDERNAFATAMKDTPDLVKKAWKLSNNNYKWYWKEGYNEIRREVYSSILEDIDEDSLAKSKTLNLLSRVGFEFDSDISLDGFVKQSLNIGDVIHDLNRELVSEGHRAIYINPSETVAMNEHFAVISEKADALKTKNELLQQHIQDTRAHENDFNKKPVSKSMDVVFHREDFDPQELLKQAEDDAAKAGGQQTRLQELRSIVEDSKSYDEFLIKISNNKNLQNWRADIQNVGFNHFSDYYKRVRLGKDALPPKEPKPVSQNNTAKNTPSVTKPEQELSSKDKLELFKYVKDELRDRINNHPGKTLQKYNSLKEGDFQDFKNPDLAKTPSERKAIEERNQKVITASEKAMDADPRLAGLYDNPDVIREQIAEYNDLKGQLRSIIDEEKEFKASIAKGKTDSKIKEIKEIQAKAKKYDFTVPELDPNQSIDMVDIVAQSQLIKNHPAKPFLKYVNSQGKLPEILNDTPGVYGDRMQKLLDKNGFDSVADAQKAVDNYRAHNELLTEMYNQRFDPIELAQSNSVHRTPFSELEKERLQSSDPADAKPLDTIAQQESLVKKGNDVMKKVGLFDYIRTPSKVLTKIGLGDEAKLIAKQYSGYLKELPKNINKITEWANRVPGKESSQKIFRYLDGTLVDENGFQNPDVLTAEEKRVGDEIKAWLTDWAYRLDLKPHQMISNYITHIFDEDLTTKEFDVDLAKIIQDKVAGQVYDPFLENRLGKMGYVQDAWRALDAYVKRATRKVYMDVALAQVKVAAEDLDIASYNYVKSYIDRVNLRPTNADILLDNSIKQFLNKTTGNAYRLGARPTSRITQLGRQIVFRGSLGLNISSALRNLVQGANTYALLGEKYTTIGYTKLLSRENQAELAREGILNQNQIQDRTLSSTKKFWSTIDKGLFSFFETAERINRGSAYFGYKARYYAENSHMVTTNVNGQNTKVRIFNDGASEEKAIAEAKAFAAKTQFTFSSVDTPVALGSDIAKTILQFQSFNTKQAEFLTDMVKNKNYKGLIRFAAASIAFLLTVGKLFGMKWQDLIPFYSAVSGGYNPPPLLSSPYHLIHAALPGSNDEFGNPETKAERLQEVVQAFAPFVPAGVQANKTISGATAIKQGEASNTAQKVQALAMGSKVLTANPVSTALNTTLKTSRTKLATFDPDIIAQVQPIFDEAKADGFGTPEADAAVANLTDSQYKVYNAIKAVDTAQNNLDLEPTVLPIVKQAEQLGFGTDAANKLISDSFPDTPEGDRQYAAYTAAKNALYGSGTSDEHSTEAGVGTIEGNWSQESLITKITNIAKAVGVNPVEAFQDIFAGNDSWQISKVDKNGNVFVNRMPLATSQAIKKSEGGLSSEYKLDHSVALEISGNNGASNLQLIPTGDINTPGTWAWNSPTEDLLGQAMSSGKITGAQAREYMIRFKATAGEPLSPALQKEFKDKYHSEPLTPDQIKQLVG